MCIPMTHSLVHSLTHSLTEAGTHALIRAHSFEVSKSKWCRASGFGLMGFLGPGGSGFFQRYFRLRSRSKFRGLVMFRRTAGAGDYVLTPHSFFPQHRNGIWNFKVFPPARFRCWPKRRKSSEWV